MSFKLYGDDTGDLKVSDIVQVTMTYKDGSRDTKLVHRDECERYVAACLALHYSPGINPHNNGATAQAMCIEVHELKWYGPFWWSTPDLQNNYDIKGARILQEGSRLFTWRRPDV